MARRILPIALTVLIVFVQGCSSSNTTTTQPAITTALLGAPDGTQPVSEAAAPGIDPQQPLASQTGAYAEAVARILADPKRTAPPRHIERVTGPTTAPMTPADGVAAASTVSWLDPNQFDLSVGPRQSRQIFLEPDKSASGANRPISITDAADQPKVSKPAAPLVIPSDPVDKVEQRLLGQIRSAPRDVVAQLDYQLLQLIREDSNPQTAPLAELAPEDREIVSALVDALANFRNTLRVDPGTLHNRKVRPLLDMADRIRARDGLMVPTLTLCSRVDGFGKYEPMDARFTAGKDNPAILYCEVENFSSQLNADHLWETRLFQVTTLYSEGGVPQWEEKSKAPTVDLARNRRHDFYLVKKIILPRTLTPGNYVLKLSIRDDQANRVAEATLPVVMGAN